MRRDVHVPSRNGIRHDIEEVEELTPFGIGRDAQVRGSRANPDKRLVGRGFVVGLPAFLELGPEFRDVFSRWANLDASIDTTCNKGMSETIVVVRR